MLLQLGLRRLQADPNVYVNTVLQVVALVYVDDILFFGPDQAVVSFIDQLARQVLLKRTGSLNDKGSTLQLLGRRFKRVGDSIEVSVLEGYFHDLLREFNMEKCRPANTPGSASLKRLLDADEPLDASMHALFRKAVGKLFWVFRFGLARPL
jgi:hypothetical protein